MNNGFENLEDMQRMQQEAVRRVREMQRRAKQSLKSSEKISELKESNNHNSVKKETTGQLKKDENISNPQNIKNSLYDYNKEQIQPLTSNKQNNFDIFSDLLKDQEKSLILLLIMLLIDEGCDLSLIFALIYLII